MAALIDQWRLGAIHLVTSHHILDEVRRAWSAPYWTAGLSGENAMMGV
jgi:hypothetical protein